MDAVHRDYSKKGHHFLSSRGKQLFIVIVDCLCWTIGAMHRALSHSEWRFTTGAKKMEDSRMHDA